MWRVLLQTGHSQQRPDCVADDAVSCEPVSAPNSLLTGKLTGNFARSGPPPRFSYLISARIQELTAEFPTQRNREFSNAYQGIFCEEQGIRSSPAVLGSIRGATKRQEPRNRRERLTPSLRRLFLLACVLASPAALAQTYPDRTVTIVVTTAAGALTDTLTRAVAQQLSE